MSDLLIFAANSSSSPLDREAWAKLAKETELHTHRCLAACQGFQLEVTRVSADGAGLLLLHQRGLLDPLDVDGRRYRRVGNFPLRQSSTPYYRIRVKDNSYDNGRALNSSWLAPKFVENPRSIFFSYSSYDLAKGLAKMQASAYVPDELKKAANESPEVRAELKKLAVAQLGETNLAKETVKRIVKLGEAYATDRLIFAANATLDHYGREAWTKLTGERFTRPREFQLEVCQYDGPSARFSPPNWPYPNRAYYQVRVRDNNDHVWFSSSDYALASGLAKMQASAYVPDELKKAANESPEVRAELKKLAVAQLGETNLVQTQLQHPSFNNAETVFAAEGEHQFEGGYTISCDVSPMTVAFPPIDQTHFVSKVKARQSLSRYWNLPLERVHIKFGHDAVHSFLAGVKEDEARICFSDATKFVEFLRDYSGPVTGVTGGRQRAAGQRNNKIGDYVVIDDESEIMYTVTPWSQRAAVLRLLQKAVVKVSLGESDERGKVKQAAALALGGLPGSLAKFVMDGTLELSTTRPDGTLEFAIEPQPQLPNEDSKLVWHPEGAAQDYEDLQFYVVTSHYRRGDWGDPTRSELEPDVDTLRDLVWWLEEIHRI